jgi:hypothetical protein
MIKPARLLVTRATGLCLFLTIETWVIAAVEAEFEECSEDRARFVIYQLVVIFAVLLFVYTRRGGRTGLERGERGHLRFQLCRQQRDGRRHRSRDFAVAHRRDRRDCQRPKVLFRPGWCRGAVGRVFCSIRPCAATCGACHRAMPICCRTSATAQLRPQPRFSMATACTRTMPVRANMH